MAHCHPDKDINPQKNLYRPLLCMQLDHLNSECLTFCTHLDCYIHQLGKQLHKNPHSNNQLIENNYIDGDHRPDRGYTGGARIISSWYTFKIFNCGVNIRGIEKEFHKKHFKLFLALFLFSNINKINLFSRCLVKWKRQTYR